MSDCLKYFIKIFDEIFLDEEISKKTQDFTNIVNSCNE